MFLNRLNGNKKGIRLTKWVFCDIDYHGSQTSVQENDNLKLTALGNYLKRDLSTLSQAANRLRKRAARDKILRAKIESIRKTL
jgi:hypothetical protein